MSDALARGLSQGLSALALSLSEEQQGQLLAYLSLLMKWNKVYNLTSVREPQQMLSHHLLDCLAAIPAVSHAFPAACDLLDVGSGGGLPSVVFAIACPHWRVTAIDTVAKKAAFIQTVAHSLKLSNLVSVHGRVEDQTQAFDLVTCRAFAELVDFTQWSVKVLKPHGRWLAMKGKYPHAEIERLPDSVWLEQIQTLTVPGVDADRCLVWLKPKSGVPE
ncbi:MAG: 16S rRNA (guanine(527)-N(7))-methyltransferase RsmG [Limnohabitans sp.]